MTSHFHPGSVYIGTAGWNVPKEYASSIASEGSHLHRYATVFNAVEINTSFYRPHRPQTYARWASSVPPDFRFGVKMPKRITHEFRLRNCAAELEEFLRQVSALEHRLGCVLVQLPPSLSFGIEAGSEFFALLRRHYEGPAVCEPRHKTWFSSDANSILNQYTIGRVAADPAIHPLAAEPGGDLGCQYFRLHGSPQMYYSNYTDTYLETLRDRLLISARSAHQVWCIFDNTAENFAVSNANHLWQILVPQILKA